MSKEKCLNIEDLFPTSVAIIKKLSGEHSFFLSMPESAEEPYKLRFLRVMNNIIRILGKHPINAPSDFVDFAFIANTKKAVINEFSKVAPNGSPIITNEATYLLVYAYVEALKVIKDFFIKKKFILFGSIPNFLQEKIDELTSSLKVSPYGPRAEVVLEEMFSNRPVVNTSTIDETWEEQRKQQERAIRIQSHSFKKITENLQAELETKKRLLDRHQQYLEETNSQLQALNDNATLLKKNILEKDLEIKFLARLSTEVSGSLNKKTRNDLITAILTKYTTEEFLQLLNIDTNKLFRPKEKFNVSHVLVRLLSTEKLNEVGGNRRCWQYLLDRLKNKINSTIKELDSAKTQMEKTSTKITVLEKQAEQIKRDILNTRHDIKISMKKLNDHHQLQSTYTDDKDLAYYDKAIKDYELLQQYVHAVKLVKEGVKQLKFDHIEPEQSYRLISDKLIVIDQLSNKIRKVGQGFDPVTKQQMMTDLDGLSRQLRNDEQTLILQHERYVEKKTKIEAHSAQVKTRLSAKGINQSFIGNHDTSFVAFWKQKLDSYWSYRCKKYAVSDFLSQCFFNNQKERRDIYIKQLKNLLSSYHYNDDPILKRHIEDGLMEFKPGVLSNKSDGYKNLHDLLIKLKDSMEIMEQEMPTLHKIK